MPVYPVSHHQWQVLRTVKRSRKPPTRRELRLNPTQSTKDGSFLTKMVEAGLLIRVTGTENEPFRDVFPYRSGKARRRIWRVRTSLIAN